MKAKEHHHHHHHHHHKRARPASAQASVTASKKSCDTRSPTPQPEAAIHQDKQPPEEKHLAAADCNSQQRSPTSKDVDDAGALGQHLQPFPDQGASTASHCSSLSEPVPRSRASSAQAISSHTPSRSQASSRSVLSSCSCSCATSHCSECLEVGSKADNQHSTADKRANAVRRDLFK